MFAPIQTYAICTTSVQDKDHISQTSSKKSKQPHPSANALVSTRKKSRHARSSFMANGSQQGAVTTYIEKTRRHGHARPGHSTTTMGHGHSLRRPGHSGMARAFRHGQGIQAWPCTARAFTAFRATVELLFLFVRPRSGRSRTYAVTGRVRTMAELPSAK